MSFDHVQTGDPIHIPAHTWNQVMDATRRTLQSQFNTPGSPATTGMAQAGVVLVKNTTGKDQDRFAVLGIDAPIIAKDDNEDEFKRQVVLSCVDPDDDHRGKFVVLQEPLADGAIGRAVIDGVTIAKVDMQNASDVFADVPGSPDQGGSQSYTIKSTSSGTAQILWAENASSEGGTSGGEQWAVVRLGAAAPTFMPTHHELITESTTWTVPDGVSLVYAVAIGQGGDGGDGMNASWPMLFGGQDMLSGIFSVTGGEPGAGVIVQFKIGFGGLGGAGGQGGDTCIGFFRTTPGDEWDIDIDTSVTTVKSPDDAIVLYAAHGGNGNNNGGYDLIGDSYDTNRLWGMLGTLPFRRQGHPGMPGQRGPFWISANPLNIGGGSGGQGGVPIIQIDGGGTGTIYGAGGRGGSGGAISNGNGTTPGTGQAGNPGCVVLFY